jgi:GNAT superfamily N-acetyltransferase
MWAATGCRLPIVAASWLFRREYLITVRPIDLPASVPRLAGVSWGRIDDPAELVIGPGGLRPARTEVRRRLDTGQECWAAWIAGELAHWRWEATRPVFLRYLERTLRPAPGDLCVVDVYTAPRYRGRGLHTMGTLLALDRARACGLTRLVGLVAWWNTPARRVMEGKTGRKVVGSIGYWAMGPGRRYFARGGVRLEGEEIVIVTAPPADAPRSGAAA